jgi:FkbM family methyltransferase
MRSIREELRNFINRFGYDFHRIGARQLGRNCLADVETLCGSRGVKVIFDVGANIGQAARLFSGRFPGALVYSFEPFPGAFKELQGNVAACRNVTTLPFGFSEKQGNQTFYLNRGSELNSLLPNAREGGAYIDQSYFNPVGTCQVDLSTVDQFCSDRQIERIDLLKIDTQGSELSVLRGAVRQLASGRVRCVLLEVNFVSLYEGQPSFEDLNQCLSQSGFRFVSFYDSAFHANGFVKWADALFVHIHDKESGAA